MDPNRPFKWKDASLAIDEGRLEELGYDFTVGFLRDALLSEPDNVEVLAELGELCTKKGLLEEGLEVDLKLCRLKPDDPTAHYNLACSLALLGRTDRAIKALRKALARGFREFALMASDQDLSSLREEPEFLDLLNQVRKALS